MAKSEIASVSLVSSLHTTLAGESLRQVAARAGVHHSTLSKALRGQAVSSKAIAALSRLVPKVRTSSEFKASAVSLQAPIQRTSSLSWTLEQIRSARDAQMNGDFALPVRLAEAMRTDDALYVAYHNRIAPQSAVQTKLIACSGARGEALMRKAAASITIERSVLEGIQGTLANHGLAIGYVLRESNESGTIINMRLTEWPLEFVSYDAGRDTLQTQVRGGPRVDITHGDGAWIAFSKFKAMPWRQAACLLPASFVWASHAGGVGDWAGGSRAHGLAQMIGRLPEGFAVADEEGALTKEAQAFLSLMQALANGEAGAAIAPPGSTTEFISNDSTAWQIFSELIQNREKAAARIYQGTDAALGSVGGAPGVDISQLFGVATTILQGDFNAIETGLRTGLYEPWTAINEGTSRYAPRLEYQLPDPDKDSKRAELARGEERLMIAIKGRRSLGFSVTQVDVNALASIYGVSPSPTLAVDSAQEQPAAK